MGRTDIGLGDVVVVCRVARDEAWVLNAKVADLGSRLSSGSVMSPGRADMREQAKTTERTI